MSSGDINNTRIDNLIQREQDALDTINVAIDKEKQEYRTQASTDINAINNKLTQYRDNAKDEIVSINEQLKTCFSCADEQQALKDTKSALADNEASATSNISSIKRQLSVDLSNIAQQYTSQLAPINQRINELKTQSSSKTQDIDVRISTLESNIQTAQATLSSNREDKTVLESKFRKLEAEVGPVKYIAEFIYNKEADRNMLEEAVRWVIVTIIFVFDPLAVLLLIASQYSFEETKRKNNPKPPTPTPTQPIKPTKREHDYTELVGKTYKGKWHPDDAPDANTPKDTSYTALIGKIFEGVRHEDDTTDNKIPAKPAPIKKKKSTKISKEDIKKAVKKITPSIPPKRGIIKKINSTVSDKDVAVITAMIENVDSDSYIVYNNKRHRKQALEIMHPELVTDVKATVDFGIAFPKNSLNGTLFLRTDFLPTKLFRFNGDSWVELDKGLLKESAYSKKYISHLIEKINEHDYDNILLDAVVAEGIADDSTTVFNSIEINRITNFNS